MADGSAPSTVAVAVAFRRFDADGSGWISEGELGALLEDLGASMSAFDVEGAARKLDTDGSGRIELREFEAWWSGRADAALGEELAALAEKGRLEHYIDLHSAAWRGDAAVCQEFLAADPTAASSPDTEEFGEGNTPLHYAAYNGHLDVATLLIGPHKCRVNARNEAGCTPLFLASQQGRVAMVELLQAAGARVNIADRAFGFSAVEVAASDAIAQLLLRGCDNSKPSKLERAPAASCPTFGVLEVTWSSRSADAASGKSLATSGFTVQVLRSSNPLDSSDEEGEEGEANAAGPQEAKQQAKEEKEEGEEVVQELLVPGADASSTIFANAKYPFHVRARVAANNAAGRSEWSDASAEVLCTSVPTVTRAPHAVLASRATITVTWDAAAANGCKIVAYRLEGAVCPSRMSASASASGSGAAAAASKQRLEWDSLGVFPPQTREHTLERVKPHQTFVFRVVCSNELGKSTPGPTSVPIRTR